MGFMFLCISVGAARLAEEFARVAPSLRHVRFLSLMDLVPLGRSGKRRRKTAEFGSEPFRGSACLRGKTCLSRSPHAPPPFLGGNRCSRCCYATAKNLLEGWFFFAAAEVAFGSH